MANEALSKLFECQGTGEVVRPQEGISLNDAVKTILEPAGIESSIIAPNLDDVKKILKAEFDPNIIAPGLEDVEKEGGTSIARSTGASGMADQAVPGVGLGFKSGGHGGPYELLGFTVKYNVPDSTDIGSVEVQVNFPSIDDAKATISTNGTSVIYNHTTPAGVKMACDLILGAPTICVNECEKLKFVGGDWIRP